MVCVARTARSGQCSASFVPKGGPAEIGRHCDGYISICDCRFGRALQEWQSISRLVELQFNDNGRR